MSERFASGNFVDIGKPLVNEKEAEFLRSLAIDWGRWIERADDYFEVVVQFSTICYPDYASILDSICERNEEIEWFEEEVIRVPTWDRPKGYCDIHIHVRFHGTFIPDEHKYFTSDEDAKFKFWLSSFDNTLYWYELAMKEKYYEEHPTLWMRLKKKIKEVFGNE